MRRHKVGWLALGRCRDRRAGRHEVRPLRLGFRGRHEVDCSLRWLASVGVGLDGWLLDVVVTGGRVDTRFDPYGLGSGVGLRFDRLKIRSANGDNDEHDI